MTRLFVYGTLMSGEPNHRILAGSTFRGRAKTRPAFSMISLGAFPGILAGGSTAIEGEAYDVDGATLRRLDQLEGHPTFYRRTLIALSDGSAAQAYLLPAPYESESMIASGSWRDRSAS